MGAKTQVFLWNVPELRLGAHAQAQFKASAAFLALLAIVGLVYFDQLTKAGAMCFTPNVQAMTGTQESMGLAWHVHPANALAPISAAAALIVVGLMCALPVPAAVKVLWMSAAISNHGEMLLRPGTIDFLALRVGDCVWVANVADLYVLVG